MKKCILVTGGHGFLGRAVAGRFKAQGYTVVGLGNGRWDSVAFRSAGFDEWVDADVTISSLIGLDKKFDIIAHCAGNGSVAYSIANPSQDFQKNVGTSAEVLEYMRLNNPSALLIYPSSAGVYGAKPDAPIKENCDLTPMSPYGHHKKMVEELCESYSAAYGLKVVLIRFFSIYGPGLTKQLLWDASAKLLNPNGEALFWGTGGETRDWLNIGDATELMLKATSVTDRLTILNGATGIRVTVAETLEILKTELGLSANIRFNNIKKAGDPVFYHADISKAKQLGWAPAVPLNDGIRQYVKWYKEHRNDGIERK